jgi:hypothetical protein
MQKPTKDEWICSQADSHAKTFLSRVAETGSPVSALDYGERCGESFAKYDPDTSSWRTSQPLLTGDLERFSGTWPGSGMMRNGRVYRRASSVPRSADGGYSLLPTPTAKMEARNATSSRQPGSAHHGGTTLTDWIWLNEGRGLPSPTFVEWIMGYPERWTDLGRLATQSFLKSSSGSIEES